jgi:hypothetical protein
MILALLVISLALLICGYVEFKKHHKDGKSLEDSFPGGVRIIVSGILSVGCIIAILVLSNNLYSARFVAAREAVVYSDQNKKIESQIALAVESYMSFEKGTYIELKPGSDILLTLSAYPDLKSNELVSKQVDVYIKNNATISSLRIEQVNASLYAFWLYFGS